MHSLGIQLNTDFFFFKGVGCVKERDQQQTRKQPETKSSLTKNFCFVGNIQKNTHMQVKERFLVQQQIIFLFKILEIH